MTGKVWSRQITVWKLMLQKPTEATTSISNHKRFWPLFQCCLYAHWRSTHNRSVVSVIIDRQQPCNTTTAEHKTGFMHWDDNRNNKIRWLINKVGLQKTTDASNLPTAKLLPAKREHIFYRIIRHIPQLHRLHAEVVCWFRWNAHSAYYSLQSDPPHLLDATAVLIYEAFCGRILCSWHIKQDKRFLSYYRC